VEPAVTSDLLNNRHEARETCAFCSLVESMDRQQNICCHPQGTLCHIVKHSNCNAAQVAPCPAWGFYCSSNVGCCRTDLYQHPEVWWVGTEDKHADGSSSAMVVCLSTNLYGATYRKTLILTATSVLSVTSLNSLARGDFCLLQYQNVQKCAQYLQHLSLSLALSFRPCVVMSQVEN
jgi:hypothetical protein